MVALVVAAAAIGTPELVLKVVVVAAVVIVAAVTFAFAFARLDDRVAGGREDPYPCGTDPYPVRSNPLIRSAPGSNAEGAVAYARGFVCGVYRADGSAKGPFQPAPTGTDDGGAPEKKDVEDDDGGAEGAEGAEDGGGREDGGYAGDEGAAGGPK